MHFSKNRTSFLLLLLACMSLLSVLSATAIRDSDAADLPDHWTLPQAVDFALQNNPEVSVARARLASSEAMTAAARSPSLPSVTLSGDYSQTDTPMHSFGNILNQGAFDGSIDFNDPGRTDDLLLQSLLSYRLYDGGQTRSGIDRAEAEQRATAGELAVVHQRLAYEVVRSYYAILQAREILEVRESAITAIEASLAVARARFELGELLQEELLNLELQQAREVESRIRAQHDLELARRSFWNLLGLQMDVQRTYPGTVEEQPLPKTMDYSAREELRIVNDRIAAAEAALAGTRGAEKPVVDTYARYQYEYGTVLGESGDSWQAGVRLSYNLYNGHLTEAEIAAARARLTEMQALKAKLDLALGLELERARIAHQQSLERLQVTGKMVEVAEESARLSRIRFQEGVILASDLIDREMRLTDARASQASARADNRVAVANLRWATGAGQFNTDNR